MEKLKNEEVKKMSVIMVELQGGCSHPYFVVDIRPGKINDSIVFVGESLERLIKTPYIYSEIPHNGMDKLYGMGEPNRRNALVSGFRNILEKEKDEWINKILNIPDLKNLIQIIEKS
jgi:hypothetical protein